MSVLLKKPGHSAGIKVVRRLQQNDVPSPKDVPSPMDDVDKDDDEAPELPPDEPHPPPIQDPPVSDGQKPLPYVVREHSPLLHDRDAYLVTRRAGVPVPAAVFRRGIARPTLPTVRV